MPAKRVAAHLLPPGGVFQVAQEAPKVGRPSIVRNGSRPPFAPPQIHDKFPNVRGAGAGHVLRCCSHTTRGATTTKKYGFCCRTTFTTLGRYRCRARPERDVLEMRFRWHSNHGSSPRHRVRFPSNCEPDGFRQNPAATMKIRGLGVGSRPNLRASASPHFGSDQRQIRLDHQGH